jgi:hypothetical protein
LLNVSLGFGQQQLAKRGEFYPYAAAIRIDGEVQMIAANPDPANEHPAATDVAVACFGALTDNRDEIRAGAVVTDVRTGDGEDAIRVDLEHAEGQALAVLLPYTKGRLDQEISYGLIRAAPGHRQIWP